MNKTKHTPLPWEILPYSNLARIHGANDEPVVDDFNPSFEDAEFIIRAVNSHEELLDLCKCLLFEVFGTNNPTNAKHPLAARGVQAIAKAERKSNE